METKKLNISYEELEAKFYEFCNILEKIEFEEEKKKGFQLIIDDYCRNLVVKHFEENGYDIKFLIDLILDGGNSIIYNILQKGTLADLI